MQRECEGRGRMRWALALRWTARIWSGLSVVLLIAFAIGEGFNPSGTAEITGSLFFPIGVAVGMALAWRREILGGAITVGSLIAAGPSWRSRHRGSSTCSLAPQPQSG